MFLCKDSRSSRGVQVTSTGEFPGVTNTSAPSRPHHTPDFRSCLRKWFHLFQATHRDDAVSPGLVAERRDQCAPDAHLVDLMRNFKLRATPAACWCGSIPYSSVRKRLANSGKNHTAAMPISNMATDAAPVRAAERESIGSEAHAG